MTVRTAWYRRACSLAAMATFGCSGSTIGPSPGPGPGPGDRVAVLVGAGDIAMCGSPGAQMTAGLLDAIPGTVFTAGDNAYFHGTVQEFRDCYDPTWGRHKGRTRPAPGNHDYETPGATPYYAYFGGSAGPPGLGYYSFEAGEWHVLSLNSNVPMTPGSSQQSWLREDLDSHRVPCVAAIWHHPLFTVGPNGPTTETRDIWRTLFDAGVDVIINGHDHLYQRFGPQTPDGNADLRRGIRQFVVGTGGAELTGVARPQANLEASLVTFGVLKLTLRSSGYDWQFVTANGAVSDAGSDVCR
jgi:acid phosphatase type 7